MRFEQGPRFIMDPPSQLEFLNTVGSSVRCLVRGHPPPTVVWKVRDRRGSLDGTQLVDATDIPGLRSIVHSNGTIIFRTFSSDQYEQNIHANVYFCTASSIIGEIISRPVFVRAAMKQIFSAQVYDKYVIKNNIAVFHCRVPSYVGDDVTVTSWVTEESNFTKRTITASKVNRDPSSRYSILKDGCLHIQDITKNDNGLKFWCNVKHRLTNQVQRSSTSGTLHVKEARGSMPPQILHRKPEIRVKLGEDALMPCVAEGQPPPSLSWYFVGPGKKIQLKPFSGRILLKSGTLLLRNVSTNDQGIYECYVSNSVGNQRVKTKLVVSTKLKARIEPEDMTANVGQNVSLNCRIQGSPIHSISWRRNGQLIEMDDFSNDSKLIINRMSRNDRGMYQCFATNDISSVQATSQVLIGDIYPEFLKTFDSIISQPGPTIRLSCTASGTPEPKITWYLDDQQIGTSLTKSAKIGTTSGSFINEKRYVVGYLNISQVRIQNGGLYKCIASNKAGKASHQGRLDVYGVPRVRSMPNISAIAGQPLSVRCHAYGYPIDSFEWIKDNVTLQNSTSEKMFRNGEIKLDQALSGVHNGKYTCIAKNRQGQNARGHFWVEILVKPVVAMTTFPGNVREGIRTGLYCSVQEGSQPLTKTWLKDGLDIVGSYNHDRDMVITDTSGSSVLEIKKVGRRHNGNYTCLVRNVAGTSSFTATLRVQAPPTWERRPGNTSIAINSTVSIDCQAYGHPAPSVTWKRYQGNKFIKLLNFEIEGFENQRHYVQENGTLTIYNAKYEDAGRYSCDVTNGIPSDISQEIILSVGRPPFFEVSKMSTRAAIGKILTLPCEYIGNYPLNIKWYKKSRSILHNNNKYQLLTTPNLNGIGQKSTLRIKKISPEDGGKYECQVSNQFGSSKKVFDLVVEEPPGNVQNIWISPYANRSVVVQWDRPKTDGNSPITGYIFKYSLKSVENAFKPINLKSRSITLTDIIKRRHYDVYIRALNKVGSSADWATLPFLISQNGSVILPNEALNIPSSEFGGLMVLLLVPSVISAIIICTIIFLLILFVRKKRRERIMYDPDCKSKKNQMHLKDLSGNPGSTLLMPESKRRESTTDRYGRLRLPTDGIPNSSSMTTSTSNPYKLDDDVKISNEGYYSEVSPYATFHISETVRAKNDENQVRPPVIELKTFTPRHSTVEMSSIL